VSLLTSFAASGNPNENIIKADMQSIHIDPVESLEPPFKGLIIEENLSFGDMPACERLTAWDRLYKETNTPLY
jgi:hypothetical protein